MNMGFYICPGWALVTTESWLRHWTEESWGLSVNTPSIYLGDGAAGRGLANFKQLFINDKDFYYIHKTLYQLLFTLVTA